MVKTKIPASLGIGDKTDDPTLRPVSGSVGLSFLPNFMVLRDSADTGQSGLLPILKALKANPKYKQKGIEARRLAAGIDLSIEVLSNISKSANGCPFASAGCRMVCLADSGQRYANSGDYFGARTGETRRATQPSVPLVASNGFSGKPDCVSETAHRSLPPARRQPKCCFLQIHSRRRSPVSRSSRFHARRLHRKIPPSVRLNVFADYPWELIYPDLFGLFDGKT